MCKFIIFIFLTICYNNWYLEVKYMKHLEKNNLKIKKLCINRNIDFGKAIFHISNAAICNIYANNYVKLNLDNKLLFIPTSMLFLLYTTNLLCFSKTIVKLIEDIRDINKLKRIRKEIELGENLKQNQKILKK